MDVMTAQCVLTGYGVGADHAAGTDGLDAEEREEESDVEEEWLDAEADEEEPPTTSGALLIRFIAKRRPEVADPPS